MNETAIEIRALSKTFGAKTKALDELTLSVPRGAVQGLIGRNGAGKTTALRILMDLLRADGGYAGVLGGELRTAGRAARSRVTYVSQNQRLHDALTLDEFSRYLARLYASWAPAYAQALASRLGVAWDTPIRRMSGGEQRKAAILLAMAPRPDVLIMDEPAAGLDPVARRRVAEAIAGYMAEDSRRTILFSTHILSDLERIASHIAIIDKGRIRMQAPIEEIQAGIRRVQIIFPGDAAPPGFTCPGALRQEVSGPVVSVVARIGDEEIERLQAQPGLRVTATPVGLEDLFVELFDKEEETNA